MIGAIKIMANRNKSDSGLKSNLGANSPAAYDAGAVTTVDEKLRINYLEPECPNSTLPPLRGVCLDEAGWGRVDMRVEMRGRWTGSSPRETLVRGSRLEPSAF